MSAAGRKPEQESWKSLPHNVELEQAYLGELLVKPHLLDHLNMELRPHHFFDPLHGRMFERIRLRLAGGESVAPHVLLAAMSDDPGLREVGGLNYLMTMAKAAPGYDARQFEGMAREIRSLAGRREIVQLGEDISERARRGGDIGTLIDEISRRQTDCDKPDRFRLVPFNDITASTESECLVQGLIPKPGIMVVYGPPKCGKSFWVADLLMHVALGWKYRGRRVKQGVVLYGAFEGGKGFGKRIDAFRQKWLADHSGPVPFYLLPVRVDLIKDHGELIASIERQLRATGDARLDAVALDTLNRSLVGSETDDMGAYIAAADAIRERFDCVVIVVHHCGVDKTRPRGHTSLTGAVDAQIAMKRQTDIVIATVEFMKDGPEDAVIVSRLEVVSLGADEDGDEITSCVVVPVEAAMVPKRSSKREGLTKRQKLALEALQEALVRSGKPLPAAFGLPHGVTGVEVKTWRKELFSRDVLDNDAANPREDYRRLKTDLQGKHLIAIRDGVVWLAQAPSSP